MQTYLRPPYLGINANFSNEVNLNTSPNKTHAIVISHCWTYKRGAKACLFHLVDNNENIIEDFTPLTTNAKLSWSEDNSMIAICVGEAHRGILIYHIEEKAFSFFKSNSYTFKFDNNQLKLYISDKFVEQLNSSQLLGGGESELPRVKYVRPDDITVDVRQLKKFNKSELENYFDVGEANPIYIDPLERGFWPFNGRLPQNTTQGYNGRDFEMYQLETFAKFGDSQSIEWLFEIKEKTKNEYSKWDKVSDYLGHRERRNIEGY